MSRTHDEGYGPKVYSQITHRIDADIQAIMAATDCDRSTAVRSILRVGLMHGNDVTAMVAKDKTDRQRRLREANSRAGRIGMARRYNKPANQSET